MKKMKSLLLLMAVLVFIGSAQAGFVPSYLPESDIESYNGYTTYSGNGVSAYMEFAVYDTRIQQLPEFAGMEGYQDETYVYAYQIFNFGGEDIQSVSIFGFNPDAVTSEDNLGASDTLDGVDSEGVETDEWLLDEDEAVWFFEGGTLIQSEQSWFLLIYSDYSPVAGEFEVNPASDPYVPGGEDNSDPIPEPMTLALLLGGAALSFKRKK